MLRRAIFDRERAYAALKQDPESCQNAKRAQTGLADAKSLRIFDDNVAEVLFFFESPVIEAPLNREVHFQTSFRKFHQRLRNLGFPKRKMSVFMACQARYRLAYADKAENSVKDRRFLPPSHGYFAIAVENCGVQAADELREGYGQLPNQQIPAGPRESLPQLMNLIP
jgi:hypothetical protein